MMKSEEFDMRCAVKFNLCLSKNVLSNVANGSYEKSAMGNVRGDVYSSEFHELFVHKEQF